MKKKEHTIIEKRYLAESLAFLGYRYRKTNNSNEKTKYIFEDSYEFKEALHALLKLRKTFGKNKDKY